MSLRKVESETFKSSVPNLRTVLQVWETEVLDKWNIYWLFYLLHMVSFLWARDFFYKTGKEIPALHKYDK